MFTIYLILGGVISCIGAKSIGPTNTVLFFISDNKLWRGELLINGSSSSSSNIFNDTLVSNNFVVDYDIDVHAQRLYWIDRAAQIFSRSLDRDSSDKLALQYEPAVSTARLAIDSLSNKFYVVDGESQEIDVLDMKPEYRTVLFERDPVKEEHVIREKPRRLSLDSDDGLMFILTDLNNVKNIYRSNMDGTSKKLLITNVGSNEILVSHSLRRIFWANEDQKTIEVADYEGNDRETVVKISGPVTLTTYKDQLYWLAKEIGSNAKNVINSCRIQENACEDGTTHQIPLKQTHRIIRSLKLIHTSEPKAIKNPCQPDNAGCQHLCLLKPSPARTSCACSIDSEPAKNDPKMCRTKSLPRRRRWDIYSQQPTLRSDPPMQIYTPAPIPIFYIGRKK